MICTILNVLLLILFAWVILGWVVELGRIPAGHPVRSLYDLIGRGVNPVLRPIRAVLPPVRIGNAALDLSVIAVFVALWIVMSVVC
ncbi:MAG: YggT family protein [Acidimicrobiia bacterium]|nr:YggT family protein [Acidimicrobiia bacterium]